MIFDLYSGTGTIAQMLAPVAKKVVGVEIVEEAVEAAKVNAELNGLSNCSFIAGDVLKVIDELTDKPDLIVLDPPRDGIHPKALQKIIDFGVNRIVYISCKPTSLTRDLELLQGRDYRVEKCVGVDMFPFTGNVETVCLLSHKSPDSHINAVSYTHLDVYKRQIYSQAKKLHIQTEATRVVYLIETRDEKDVMALEAVRSVFAPRSQDIITAVDQKNIVVVKSVGEEDTYETLDEVAVMLAKMLNTDEDT